jgi:hypothetical protein
MAGGHTIPWTKPTRTNNIIQNTSKDVRQYHGQNQQGKTMLYKTPLFFLVGFGHGIV